MAENKIDTPRSPEPRASKVTGQAMSSVKSTLPVDDEAPAFSSLLAALEQFADPAQPPLSLQSGQTPQDAGDLPALPHLSALAQQDALLQAQGHAPWMSLVGQTTRLDTQGDVDLRQGAATDFLSGRGNLTQLAHRQGLQTSGFNGVAGANGAGAHTAFLDHKTQSNQLQVQSNQALAATNFDGEALDLKPDQGEQSHSALLTAASDVVDEPIAPMSARGELAAAKLHAAGHQSISLQGMTAVQPQTLEGLKDLLRGARSSALDESNGAGKAASKSGSGNGAQDLLGAAIGGAMGAMVGGAGAGMQGGNQTSSDLGQNSSGQQPAEREQEVSEQVAFWVHQKSQNASLSIQHEGKPIQVQVQLNGQEAHVRFAANDEQARQLLADGQSQLRELLEAQGLSLSGVSVDAGGAHQQGAGGRSDDAQRAQPKSARVAVNAANAAELPVDALNTRQAMRAGPSGVDLFV
ncbi:flagellar hook-length control protein FliK [Comamonas sp. Y33R10-2]|uniref:flagellar hook-length control protein FliK n=1 Tax=Comamonas sp. Y33R10-2 TaxID=2853257 RepID=UPI001C5CA957|nr:flagellar hook-length control protein FliK [Comamonas sp. Y33R10-2]QXZ09043.1 flagellar hook-length control protein FliK [Comamonas sp. Y33R10-2]